MSHPSAHPDVPGAELVSAVMKCTLEFREGMAAGFRGTDHPLLHRYADLVDAVSAAIETHALNALNLELDRTSAEYRQALLECFRTGLTNTPDLAPLLIPSIDWLATFPN